VALREDGRGELDAGEDLIEERARLGLGLGHEERKKLMPKSTTTVESFVSPEEFREVLLDFESYPEFLPEVKKVVVHEKSASSVSASFFVEVKVGGAEIKTEYTVRYTLGKNEISWKLEK
jgi:hypothetical protein